MKETTVPNTDIPRPVEVAAPEPRPTQSDGGVGPAEPDTDSLSSTIIHDLREPLRSIRFVTGFLREDRPDMDEATARALHRIDDLAARADRLIGALAEHARVGREAPRRAPVDLGELAREIIWDLERRKVAEAGEIIVGGALPTADADRALVRRVLAELITNGLTFNRSRPRRIEVSAAAADPPTLAVRDNGIGIDPGRLPVVFRMFSRLHPREEFGGGAGGGLAIARRIVERHGGRLWAASRPGEGSTFWFSLGSVHR